MHKAWISLNVCQIGPLTTKLDLIEGLKIDFSTFSRLLLIRGFINLQLTRTCINI